MLLFLASFLGIHFELVIIRYLATEIRAFAYLKNLPLIAIFLGLGLGMALGRAPRILKKLYPAIAAALFLLIANASPLNLTHIPLPDADYLMWGSFPSVHTLLSLKAVKYFSIILAILGLVVAFFLVLGGIAGEYLSQLPPLLGYGINLAGSLAGITVFTLLAFAHQPPLVWILVGFLAALPFFLKERLAIITFGLILLMVGFPDRNTFWSPYYRVSLEWTVVGPDLTHPSAYWLAVDHDFHQRIVDLSREFITRYPTVEPNRTQLPIYELPYRLVERPGEVLVVGSGAGNDAAAALRHGVTHVDAVEIDPVIIELGKKHHPEHPYDSPRVTIYVDDARAFFKKTHRKYDLIVFGFLDSLTLLTSYSSVRLDNYVYTVESFQEARSRLRKGGSLVLEFAAFRAFVADRLFATLTRAFGVPPRVYHIPNTNMIFVEGRARETASLADIREVTRELQSRENTGPVATDRWPFLYLTRRTIPQSTFWALIPFLCGALVLVRRTLGLASIAKRECLYFFLLGAGFLLLETKGVTELALLFGSTWVVNAVVIGAFLFMGLLANAVVMLRPVSLPVAYTALLALLGLAMIFPYVLLDSLPAAEKVLAASALVGLPVFFSGLIFSRRFQDVLQPPQALGVNLLGAVVGGALENSVMLAGTPILGLLAIFLYACSALFAKN